MMVDVRLVNESRGEMIREVEANRLARKLRGSRRRESLAAGAARGRRFDFVCLADFFWGSAKIGRGSL